MFSKLEERTVSLGFVYKEERIQNKSCSANKIYDFCRGGNFKLF